MFKLIGMTGTVKLRNRVFMNSFSTTPIFALNNQRHGVFFRDKVNPTVIFSITNTVEIDLIPLRRIPISDKTLVITSYLFIRLIFPSTPIEIVV